MPNSFLPKTKKQKRGNLSPDLNYWLVHSSKTLILAGLFIFASAFIDLPEKSFTGSLAFTCHVPCSQCAGPHPCPTSVDVDVEIETLKGGNHTYTHTRIYIYICHGICGEKNYGFSTDGLTEKQKWRAHRDVQTSGQAPPLRLTEMCRSGGKPGHWAVECDAGGLGRGNARQHTKKCAHPPITDTIYRQRHRKSRHKNGVWRCVGIRRVWSGSYKDQNQNT